MPLNSEESLILSFFKKNQVRKSQYLPIGALQEVWRTLSGKAEAVRENPFDSLIDSGLIFKDAIGYGLTQKGFEWSAPSPL